jgi:hypothetical protein
VSDGTTFYSNRAYISYNTAYATDGCGTVGNTYAAGMLTVPSSHVYSLGGAEYAFNTFAVSFNFADLNRPVPASAYMAMPQCSQFTGGAENILDGKPFKNCEIIIEDEYKPYLAVMPELYALEPAWAQCDMGLGCLFE